MSDDASLQTFDVSVADHGTVLTPSEAADRLGIKPAMLRRHAKAYEDIFDRLPRNERGARQYPIQVVQRLQHASELYRTGGADSVAAALEILKRPPAGASESLAPSPTTGSSEDLLRRLLTEVQAQRELLLQASPALPGDRSGGESGSTLEAEVIRLQAEVLDLERRNRALIAAVERLEAELEDARSATAGWLGRFLGR